LPMSIFKISKNTLKIKKLYFTNLFHLLKSDKNIFMKLNKLNL